MSKESKINAAWLQEDQQINITLPLSLFRFIFDIKPIKKKYVTVCGRWINQDTGIAVQKKDLELILGDYLKNNLVTDVDEAINTFLDTQEGVYSVRGYNQELFKMTKEEMSEFKAVEAVEYLAEMNCTNIAITTEYFFGGENEPV